MGAFLRLAAGVDVQEAVAVVGFAAALEDNRCALADASELGLRLENLGNGLTQ